MGAHFRQKNVSLLGTANDSRNYIYHEFTHDLHLFSLSSDPQLPGHVGKPVPHRKSSSLQMGSRRKRAVPRRRVRWGLGLGRPISGLMRP